jgi:3'5'-cyclic nucleotide phosphodiesterase
MGHLLDRIPSILRGDARFSPVSQSRARTESDPGVLNHDTRAVFPMQNGNDTELPQPLPLQTSSSLRPMLKKSVSVSHGPFESTTKGTGTDFRNLLAKTILSTDMSVHFQWMPKFEQLRHYLDTESEEGSDLGKATDDVDSQTRLLLCQALIKCADISNPVSASV